MRLLSAVLFLSASAFAGESGIVVNGKRVALSKDNQKTKVLVPKGEAAEFPVLQFQALDDGTVCYYLQGAKTDNANPSIALSCVKK